MRSILLVLFLCLGMIGCKTEAQRTAEERVRNFSSMLNEFQRKVDQKVQEFRAANQLRTYDRLPVIKRIMDQYSDDYLPVLDKLSELRLDEQISKDTKKWAEFQVALANARYLDAMHGRRK